MVTTNNTTHTKMNNQHEPYTATQRYFRCCDLLDEAEHNGASPKRIARLRAWVAKLVEEAGQEQAEAVQQLRDSVHAMLRSLPMSFGTINPQNN